MALARTIGCLFASLIALGGAQLLASPTRAYSPLPPLQSQLTTSPALTLEAQSDAASLRTDVARHPHDFLVFQTQAAARRFLSDHLGANPERDPRLAVRGIQGYWQGKTLVVLPILSN
jgi:hypothetical protein